MLTDRLLQLKAKSGLTNQQIAEKSGVSLSTVQRLMSNSPGQCTHQNIVDVVRALGGSLDYIEGIEHSKELPIEPVVVLYERALARKNKYIVMLITLCLIMMMFIVGLSLFIVLNGYI